MDDASEIDRDVDDSIRMFERAHVGSAKALTPIRPSRILLVLDGSEQDITSVAAANHLRSGYNTETLVLDARDLTSVVDSGRSELATETARSVSGSRAIVRPPGEAFEAILQALKTHDVDLMVVPCPFGRPFDKVGTDSVGTVIDILLSRCPVPFLVIRHPGQTLAECVGRVCMMVGSECDVESRAAAWAFGLAAPGGEVSLDLVVEKEHFENVRSIMETVDPGITFDVSMLSDALASTHQNLHAAMNATARELKLRYHLAPHSGELAPPQRLTNAAHQLLVMPIEVDDRFTQGFVIDHIRHSPHPVLVVAGHVLDTA
jgi:hypothetical protein